MKQIDQISAEFFRLNIDIQYKSATLMKLNRVLVARPIIFNFFPFACNFLFSTFVLYTKQPLIEVNNYPNLYDGERI